MRTLISTCNSSDWT